MSRMLLPTRRGALACAAALIAAAAASTPASASTLTQHVKCRYPLLEFRGETRTITADFPASTPVDELTPQIPLTVTQVTDVPDQWWNALIELGGGSAQMVARSKLSMPGGFTVPMQTRANLAGTFAPGGNLTFSGTGVLPSIRSEDVGIAPLDYDAPYLLNMALLDLAGQPQQVPALRRDVDGNLIIDSDNDPNTFDVSCKPDAGQPTKLGQFNFVPACPLDPEQLTRPLAPTEVGLTAADLTATSLHLRWKPTELPPSCVGSGPIASYRITTVGGPEITVPASVTDQVISGLEPDTGYEFQITARDASGHDSDPLDVLLFTMPAPIVDWTRSYATTGGTTLPTLVKGNVAVAGTSLLKFKAADRSVSADFKFGVANARLLSSGVLPVTAKVGLVPATLATGSLVDGTLSLMAKVRIKVLEAKLFGAIPLAAGNGCQTKSVSTIHLASTASFNPEAGGTLVGRFAISDLNGCESLNGLVSPLTAGTANTITLTLAPQAAG